MLGQNPVANRLGTSEGFKVHSVFYTIQGEGPYAGRPAIFVRFSDCNLRCYFCDTEFTGGQHFEVKELTHFLVAQAMRYNCRLFVFTGGEPMLQEVFYLAGEMNEYFSDQPISGPEIFHVQIETAGIIWPNFFNSCQLNYMTLVCSPKTPKIHEKIAQHCIHFKYIIRAGEVSQVDGLPMYSTQREKDKLADGLWRPRRIANRYYEPVVWVQPCDEVINNTLLGDPGGTEANIKAAADIAMRYGYRLCLQIHKIAGLP